ENSIRIALEKRPEIVFAYIHGSFAKGEDFKDIDVAVYLKDVPPSPLQYELTLEAEQMASIVRYPVDVRILNTSPLSFKYNVIKEGVLLLVRDDDLRADFQEATLAGYFDFAPYRKMYLKETLGLGA
ncbi:MAG: hypothetical protein A3J72_08415, partial [Nitrospirae bacterium RIFCSPHIGHO2_02_FULL_40_19]